MRMNLTREHFILKGATCYRDRASSAVAYVYTSRSGKPAAMVFQGKAVKPAWHFNFSTEAARETRVRAFFAGVQATEAARLARFAARKAWANPYKVGDVFSTCWGYDQTNREYYEVVEVRGKHLIVRELASGYVETQWLAGKSVPLPGKYIGEPARVLAQQGGFRDPRHQHWASFDKPTLIAGVKTYDAHHVSSYA